MYTKQPHGVMAESHFPELQTQCPGLAVGCQTPTTSSQDSTWLCLKQQQKHFVCSYAIAKSLQQQFVILRIAFVTRIATTDMVLLQCALCSYAVYLSVTRDILFNIYPVLLRRSSALIRTWIIHIRLSLGERLHMIMSYLSCLGIHQPDALEVLIRQSCCRSDILLHIDHKQGIALFGLLETFSSKWVKSCNSVWRSNNRPLFHVLPSLLTT